MIRDELQVTDFANAVGRVLGERWPRCCTGGGGIDDSEIDGREEAVEGDHGVDNAKRED